MTTALAQDVGLACSRSKVRIPRQTLMARPRLIARLDEQPHARLRLVQAPAGYGKTSLLQLWSSYLRSAGKLRGPTRLAMSSRRFASGR